MNLFLLLLMMASLFAQPHRYPDAALASDPEILSIDEMKSLIQDVRRAYDTDVSSLGWTLDIQIKDESLLKHAHAEARTKDHRIIVMEAGLGRAAYMSKDHFTLLVCHELGHHLGGAPFLEGEHSWWSSDEGQADFFAAHECMKKVLKLSGDEIHVKQEVRDRCQTSEICMRIALAGEEFGKRDFLLNHYDAEPAKLGMREISLSNALSPRDSIRFGWDKYPSPQCRTDIFFQAALCESDSCVKPVCWFKP